MTTQPPPPPPAMPPPMPPYGAPPPRQRRIWPILVAVVIGVLVVAAAITIPLVLALGDDEDSDGGGSDDPPIDVEVNLDDVQQYDDLDPTHVQGDVDYDQSPPVGGNHNSVWLDCGVYAEPVREENVVHDLEHGTVWITYREDELDEDAIEELEGQLPDNGILSPYPDQDAPVVITVWGRQLELVGAEDPRIELFIEEFAGGETAPEPNASCAGGYPDPNGPPA